LKSIKITFSVQPEVQAQVQFVKPELLDPEPQFSDDQQLKEFMPTM
jgi:hypothetical protein